MARSAQEAATPPIYDANGVAVGHLSYTYGLNGMPLPEPWMANLIDVDRILADAAAVRARGAEVVLVSMHWGNEYQHEPTQVQVEQATALLNSPDIDAIIGDHVHVVQPIDTINAKPVIYGLGNSLSNQTDPAPKRDGMIAYLTITETAPGTFVTERVAYTPTWVHYPGTIIRPVTLDTVPESYRRTAENLNLLGTFDGPVVYDPAELR
jgi:poly-gamma-glutamate synthesis protein (capsule biosynthesis protein)